MKESTKNERKHKKWKKARKKERMNESQKEIVKNLTKNIKRARMKKSKIKRGSERKVTYKIERKWKAWKKK